MKALILNSGLGKRMGSITKDQPKCMTQISDNNSILSYQLEILNDLNIYDIVITTGYYNNILEDYCKQKFPSLEIKFINNPLFDSTNYIYSIYLSREFLNDDLLLMHGDLVFEKKVLSELISKKNSSMTISTKLPLPEKDFKAVIKNGMIRRIGVEFFDNARTAQPLYFLKKKDWLTWLNSIVAFCEKGDVNCYAENAFNVVSDTIELIPYDYEYMLCEEIDTEEDLIRVKEKMRYMGIY